MFSAVCLREVAIAALLVSQGTSALQIVDNTDTSSSQCSTICQQVQNPHLTGSLGGSIVSSISEGGNADIVVGGLIEPGVCGHESSAIWNLWANAYGISFPSQISHIVESGLPGDRVCIDKVMLAKLTAAASGCHSQLSGGSARPPTPPGHSNTVVFPDGGANSGSQINLGSGSHEAPAGGAVVGGDTTVVSGGNTNQNIGVTTSSTSWGHGNVNQDNICFRIKDKRTERYLTTGGSEYAFAYYPQYYSVFRARPSRSAEGAYTLDEINRNGATVNYPVKINSGLGSFKPLTGDKDALFTFSPAAFGDSCWGVPNKKMSRRHDWGGWGDNYRQASSGDACADIELEEADC